MGLGDGREVQDRGDKCIPLAASTIILQLFFCKLLIQICGEIIINLCLHHCERLLLNHVYTLGFLAPGGEEFNPGPETRLDRSELLCNKVLLKHKGDRESF